MSEISKLKAEITALREEIQKLREQQQPHAYCGHGFYCTCSCTGHACPVHGWWHWHINTPLVTTTASPYTVSVTSGASGYVMTNEGYQSSGGSNST